MAHKIEKKESEAKDTQPISDEFVSPYWLDSLPVGVAYFDLNGRITWVNRHYSNIVGLPADELVNTEFSDVVGISLRPGHCPVSRVLETGCPASTELIAAHHPVETNRFSVKTAPVKNASGELLGATAIVQMASDRTAMEKALQESEFRLKEAQRLTHIGSWELDLENNQLFWSDEIFNIFEIDPARFDATYEAFLAVIHPDDRQKVDDAYTSSIEKKEPYEITHRLKMPDGRIKYVSEKGKTFLDDAGKPLRSIGTVWDVTARIWQEQENLKLQKRYHQSQRLETVGRLAGGVAHDFNNMLSVILGRTDLLLERVDNDEETQQSLSEIQHAAERSADLIRQLLTFARRQSTRPIYINLNDIITGMMKMLCRLIGEQIELEWIPCSDLGTTRMDPSQLEQVMANLCVNARDAIDGVGHITIETQNVTFDDAYSATNPEVVPGQYIMVAVSDSGCGMDAEVQQSIFEPFFTTKQPGEGTGLGLATVFGIVKQNGGLINVYSEPGQGTSFKIYFTRHQKDAVDIEERQQVALPRGNREVILLVEDEAMVLEVNRSILENLNYRVLPASTPNEAIKLVTNAKNLKINLLVTDVIMPEMNGAELSVKIESMIPGIPILYTSAYTANVVSRHCVLKDGMAFLQKPVSREALALKVKELLSNGNGVIG